MSTPEIVALALVAFAVGSFAGHAAGYARGIRRPCRHRVGRPE